MAVLRCPTCDREFDVEETTAMPFCSTRCRLIDLGRWLNEEQRLVVERQEEEEDEG